MAFLSLSTWFDRIRSISPQGLCSGDVGGSFAYFLLLLVPFLVVSLFRVNFGHLRELKSIVGVLAYSVVLLDVSV